MKWPFLLGLLLLPSLAAATPPAKQKGSGFFPYPIHVSTLDNGLTIARVPYPSPGLLAYYTVVRVGSRNEVETGRTGFAHFFEHMMFKGTPKYPEGAREKVLSRLGFNENAFTTDDITAFHSFGPSSGLKTLIELEADRFAHLDYSKAAFQTEAKAVLGEYHKGAANPFFKIEEALAATAFKVHTYRHTTMGFYEDILKMPEGYEYSREFFKRWYTPDNTLIFIVGDFDDAQLMQWMKDAYGPWRGKAANIDIPQEPPQEKARATSVDWPTPTLPRFVTAWRTPASGDDNFDGPIQTILAPYLVGPTSPTYRSLVLEKQLVESISPYAFDSRDPQLFGVITVLKDEKNLPAVRKEVESAVARVASGKIDLKRLEAIKSHLRYELLMSFETADHVAAQLAYMAGIIGRPLALDAYYQKLALVRPEQLTAFAKKHLTSRNQTTLTLKSQSPKGAEKNP
jgi:zinc protease